MKLLEKEEFPYWEHEGYCLVVVEGLVEIRRESPYNKTVAWTFTLEEAEKRIAELKTDLSKRK